MVFSSSIFLFAFLPIVLGIYFFLRMTGRSIELQNGFLMLASLAFYSWGEKTYVMIMIFSIILNHYMAILLSRIKKEKNKKAILIAAVSVNLLLLSSFKYAEFIAGTVSSFGALLGFASIHLKPVHLPIGISFFTFQAISYIVDVYRKEANAESKLINTGLYISLFPQLIAGPIVRFVDIQKQLHNRNVSISDFAAGARRFVVGLSKKVLVANVVAKSADGIFAANPADLTSSVAWFGLLCYTLQIYFDFSGYSDMAIGLGRMFGFHYKENFNYPYISRSVREFWRRWHISLSTWFRDYLYIPLGGNRISTTRTYLNLFIVFGLCGLWHGAAWTFVAWGIGHGLFLVLERGRFGKYLGSFPSWLGQVYTLLVIANSWVLFRAADFGRAMEYYKSMYGLSGASPGIYPIQMFADPMVTTAVVAGVIFSAPLVPYIQERIQSFIGYPDRPLNKLHAQFISVGGLVLLTLVLLASILRVAVDTYNPFIYFRF